MGDEGVERASDDRSPSATDEQLLRAGLEAVAATLPEETVVVDRSFRYVRVNTFLEEFAGRSAHELLGRPAADVTPLVWQAVESYFQRALNGETVPEHYVGYDRGIYFDPLAVDRESMSSDVRYYRNVFYPVVVDGEIAGVAGASEDITNTVWAWAPGRRRERKYEILAGVAEACRRSTSDSELFGQLCQVAVSTERISYAWVAIFDGTTFKVGGARGVDNGYLTQLMEVLKSAPQQPDERLLRRGSIFVANDFNAYPQTGPWRRASERAGFGSSMSLPLEINNRPAASLMLHSPTKNSFDDALVEAWTEAAALASFALSTYAAADTHSASIDALTMRDGVLGAISQGILIADATTPDHPIIYASPSFQQLVGYSADEILGRNSRFLQGPETDRATAARIAEALAQGIGCSEEILNYKKDGRPFWNHLTISPVFDDEGRLVRFIGLQADVTERRRLERQLIESQRLELIGSLAGGIAHDFNNLLLVMRSYVSVLNHRLEDPESTEVLERIDAAIDRGADFTRQLLAYSRRQMSQPRSLNLNDLITEVLRLLERAVGEDIEVQTSLAPDLPSTLVDPRQIEQVILNLVANARDAMPDGGILTVRTTVAALHPDIDVQPVDLGKPHVLLEVSDTGVGMDGETRARVFEPFFTTKAEGTGLGLATVKSLVEQGGGEVHVYSEPGLGTSFKLYFPVEDLASATSTMWSAPPKAVENGSVEGRETVLVVEDAAEARRLVGWLLSQLGYDVLEASNGLEALALSRRHTGRIDVLLTDVVMPMLNGRQLAERLLEERPDLRVLYASGHPANVLRAKDLIDDQVAFLEKPYRAADAAALIRQLLAS